MFTAKQSNQEMVNAAKDVALTINAARIWTNEDGDDVLFLNFKPTNGQVPPARSFRPGLDEETGEVVYFGLAHWMWAADLDGDFDSLEDVAEAFTEGSTITADLVPVYSKKHERTFLNWKNVRQS